MAEIAAIVLPVFGLIAVGWVTAATRLLSERVADGVAEFVFTIAMPALIFRTMLTNQLPAEIPWGYWLAYFGGIGAVWAATQLMARYAFRAEPQEAVIAGLTVAQSNLVLAGIPLVIKAYGEDAAVPVALLIAINLPATMTTASLLLEATAGRSAGAALKNVGRGLTTHPILIAIVLGLAGRLVGLKLPDPVDQIFVALSQAGPPGALFALGMAMRQYGLGGRLPFTVTLTIVKLLVTPLAVYLLAKYVFTLPPTFTGVAVLFASMPAGVNVYLFAVRYRTGVQLASSAIALSTAAAVLASGFWLWVLGVG